MIVVLSGHNLVPASRRWAHHKMGIPPHWTLMTSGAPHHATLMLKSGVHPKIVSERLGHATLAFTLDTYSHVVPRLQEAAAKLFDDNLTRLSI